MRKKILALTMAASVLALAACSDKALAMRPSLHQKLGTLHKMNFMKK